MDRFATAAPAPPALVLGIALTISRYQRPRNLPVAVNSRYVRLLIDPSIDLLFVAEATLPGNLKCLGALTQPGVHAVELRAARLEMLPEAPCTGPHRGPTLRALASGNCFLTANNRKVLIGSFGERNVRPDGVELEVQRHVNLLELLRGDWFTLELSGTHRRRLNRPLPLRLQLEFDVHETTLRAASQSLAEG